MKKLIALVVVAAGLLVPTLAHAEVAFSATQWPPSWNQDMQNFQNTPLTHYAFDIVDTFNSGSTDYSFIRVSTPGPQPFCTSLQDEYCIPLAKKYGWWIIRLLPVCSTVDEKSECIEGLEVTGADGIKKKYVHSGTYSRNYFPADTERGLGVGSGSSMWVDPQAPDTGNGYFITVSGDAGGPADATTFPLTTFDATVVPFKTVLGNFDAPEAKIANGQGIFMTKPGTNWPPECIWMQKGKCGVATEFDSAVRLKFIVHLPSTLSHWVIGRLGTPALAIDPIGSIGTVSYERLSVEANPISVPMIGGKVAVEQATQAIKDEWSRNNCPNCEHGIWAVNGESSNEGAFRMVEMFKPFLGDKSMVSIKNFSFSSMQNSQENMRRCDRKGSISGLVATNASMYVGRPPVFDGTSLTYKVGAMHYTADGEIFKGVYDLFMPEETAKCLYGFSDAPISATVSVTSEAGENSVATSVLHKGDGWIHLNAAGFTFSNPTIKVKLIGTKTASSSQAGPTVMADGQNVQWCAKGNAKKKVTGLKPVCPKGYKKIPNPLSR